MPLHLLYGLCLDSERELPGAPLAPTGRPVDGTLRFHRHLPREVPEAPGFRRGRLPDGRVILAWADHLAFLVGAGGIETFCPDPARDRYALDVLTGLALAWFLRLRGVLVLHGSAVGLEGGAVGFVGPAGAGKSTSASALVGAGAELLADDLLVLAAEGEGFSVLPGAGHGRLRPDAADRHAEATEPHAWPRKRYWRPDPPDPAPRPLRRLYLLEVGERAGPVLLRPQEALPLLVAGLKPQELPVDRALFRQLGRLVSAVPAYRMVRGSRWEEADARRLEGLMDRGGLEG